jgi:hypothetical protein
MICGSFSRDFSGIKSDGSEVEIKRNREAEGVLLFRFPIVDDMATEINAF